MEMSLGWITKGYVDVTFEESDVTSIPPTLVAAEMCEASTVTSSFEQLSYQ